MTTSEQQGHNHPDDLVDALLVASRALVGIAARSLPDGDDVTPVQFRTLVLLASHGPITTGQLAGLLGIHASTATRLVDRLEAKRYVARAAGDDRREVVLRVGPAGSRLLREVTSQRRRDLSAVVERLEPSTAADLVAALAAFSEAAGEIPDSRWSGLLDLTGPRGATSRSGSAPR